MKLLRTFIISLIPIGLLTGFYLWPEQKLPNGLTADKLVVHKSERRLQLWANNELIKTYKISLGGNPEGHKVKQGDSRTPEGLYYINDKNPSSQFHLNLGISYPNAQDKTNSANPGGDIKIHGLKNGNGWIGKFQRLFDWTDGCIAVTNSEIEELYNAVPIGTPIQINP
ncbi:MAG: L,D-transpeptidase family protein [Cyclobacteriaceae bacterium]